MDGGEIIPEPMVLTDQELPLRPRCWHCAGIRVDYTRTSEVLGGISACSHVWTDDDPWERCAGCGREYRFPHLCREHLLCGLCHPPL